MQGEAQIVASVWQRRALGTCSRDVFRYLLTTFVYAQHPALLITFKSVFWVFLLLAFAPKTLPFDLIHVSCLMHAITLGLWCHCAWYNRRLAAKAGGISPLYHVLVAHECSLLPSVSVPALPPP